MACLLCSGFCFSFCVGSRAQRRAPQVGIMSVYYSAAKEEVKPGFVCRRLGFCQGTDGRDRGHQKWKENLLKHTFCSWLSFVSVDCCRCGRGALSARLTLLSVLRPDGRISGLSLFMVHCRGAFLGVAGRGCRVGGVKHRGGFCHLKSAPGPCCGAGDEGRELRVRRKQSCGGASLQLPQGEPAECRASLHTHMCLFPPKTEVNNTVKWSGTILCPFPRCLWGETGL